MRAVLITVMAGLASAGLAEAAEDQTMRPLPRPEPVLEAPAAAAEDADAAQAEAPPPGPTAEGTLVFSSKAPTPRPLGLLDGQAIRLALSAARRGDWNLAAALAEKEGEVGSVMIEWLRLRNGRGSFADYRAFLADHADWPGLALLGKRGENAMTSGEDPAMVRAYFADRDPQTAVGVLRLAAAHDAMGDAEAAKAVLARAWATLDMSAAEEALLLDAHADRLEPHHAARLDRALWEGDRAAAERMRGRVDEGRQAMARARLALQANAGGIDALLKAVPKRLENDPGLAYDRMDWRIGKRRRSEAGDMILASSDSAETLGRPAAWANWRRALARQEMRSGNARRAYALASSHHIAEPTTDYSDLEWLSGYIALRYLDDPARALTHFQQFRAAVFTPISLGRAGYWLGRAHEALGDKEAAAAAYAEGAKHQTSFYGLLAAERAGLPMDPALIGARQATDWRQAEFAGSEVFRAAQLFFNAGDLWETGRFLRHLAESLEPQELLLLGDFTADLGDPYLAVRVGKQAAREGGVAVRAYYPLTNLGPENLPVPEELALSIARRESEFRSDAVSHAGARGLMQVMPATARQVARQIGLPYSQARLTADPTYNARLGSAYLAGLIRQFGGNYLLVSAGYNAGPHRAKRWIEQYGDPRDPGVDPIDWIEHIPFRETRNYVMRVTESIPVYRARLTGEVEPIRMTEMLKR